MINSWSNKAFIGRIELTVRNARCSSSSGEHLVDVTNADDVEEPWSR
jgi:hypothetical protein